MVASKYSCMTVWVITETNSRLVLSASLFPCRRIALPRNLSSRMAKLMMTNKSGQGLLDVLLH